jgi:hypothetical protein
MQSKLESLQIIYGRSLSSIVLALLTIFMSLTVYSHGLEGADAAFVQAIDGPAIGPFIYLGAKHMVTGYDHLLFLFGVIFFLYNPRHIFKYVTLFAIGHSLTLLFGVLADLRVNAYLIDAIIGFSIAYKAFENINGFKNVFSFNPRTDLAVFIFGLFHGLGLATKLQEFNLSETGIISNIISFNIGVELGQLFALSVVLIGIISWRGTDNFSRNAFAANVVIMTAGFLLTGYQLSQYYWAGTI